MKKYKIKKSKKTKEDFVFGKMETIIFPSFNPIISGVPLNSRRSKRKRNYIGPLLSSGAFEVGKANAYMLDGTQLGKISKIKS